MTGPPAGSDSSPKAANGAVHVTEVQAAAADSSTAKSQIEQRPQAVTLANASVLAGFKLSQVLQQDAKTRSAILLGTFTVPGGDAASPAGEEPAIILLEKTHFAEDFYASIGAIELPKERTGIDANSGGIEGNIGHRNSSIGDAPNTALARQGPLDRDAELRHFSHLIHLGTNDIYGWFLGYLKAAKPGSGPADVKFSIIRPATATHIAKYSEQDKIMIHETPQLYREATLPWIESQDPSRIAWVDNILQGRKERENVVYRDDDPASGFVLLPDLKWDRRTLPSLYLIAIARDPKIRSLRDLRRRHVPLLRKIAAKAEQVAAEKYGLSDPQNQARGDVAESPRASLGGKLRCFIHYPPSYFHLHVHILSADYTSHAGAIVGQAHLLNDIIDLLELGVDFTQRTLAYHVGVRSDIYNDVFGPLLLCHKEATLSGNTL